MIKFISHQFPLPDRIGLGNAQEVIHNKSNAVIAAQLNNRFEGKCCSMHSTFENTIVVNLSNEEQFLISEAYCCEYFKQKLDMIVKNQDRYSEVEN